MLPISQPQLMGCQRLLVVEGEGHLIIIGKTLATSGLACAPGLPGTLQDPKGLAQTLVLVRPSGGQGQRGEGRRSRSGGLDS